MAGFTKLFSTIITSSIWQEDNVTRIVWITMLALADAQGKVDAAVPGLASAARIDLDECERALTILLNPDKYSRTKDFEGRRIEVCDGGWIILNYTKYREQRDPDVRRKQTREAVRRHRARKNGQCKQNVSKCKPQKAQAEAEAEKRKRLNAYNHATAADGTPTSHLKMFDEDGRALAGPPEFLADRREI